MNYRQVADYVKQRQRLTARAMREPDDDWYPELYLLRGTELRREAIDPLWFDNRDTKAKLFEFLIPGLIRSGGVRVLALTVVMYGLRDEHPLMQVVREREDAGDPAPTAGLPRFQDVEGSIEQLWVHVFDAERHEGWAGEIKRPAKGPPSLAPFELIGPDSMVGALPNPIKAALR